MPRLMARHLLTQSDSIDGVELVEVIALLRPNPSRSIGIQYLIHVQLLQSLLKVLWRDTWTQI